MSHDLAPLSARSFSLLRSILQAPSCISSPIAAANSLPELSLVPSELISFLCAQWASEKLPFSYCALEGSAAAACICTEEKTTFNDLDIVFYFDDTCPREALHRIRDVVVKFVASMIPKDQYELASVYFQNMFLKSNDKDSWALFSLNSIDGPSIDIKCVIHCARGYQFTVDSLFVRLDTILDSLKSEADSPPSTPVAGARCGSLDLACAHLRNHIIHVSDPSEMAAVHGGGLLKYVALISRGYRVAPELSATRLEKFMCTRYLIDFPSHQASRFGLPVQLQRVHDYIGTHLRQQTQVVSFVRTLKGVVNRSWSHDPSPMLTWLGLFLPRRPLHPRQNSLSTTGLAVQS